MERKGKSNGLIIAKYVAEKNDIIPGFIENIINVLR